MVIFICGLFSTKAMKRLPSTFAQDFRELLIAKIVPKMENVALHGCKNAMFAPREAPLCSRSESFHHISEPGGAAAVNRPGLRVMSDILPDTDGRRR